MTEKAQNELPYAEILVDDGVVLRGLHLEEAGVVFALVEADREYLGKWLPWVESTHSPEDSRDFIAETIQKRIAGAEYGFAIVVDKAPVGHMSLMHINDGQDPEIGYWIASKMSGKGITAKAARALTEFGLSTLGLNKIIIKADPENVPSNKIAEKLGYAFAMQVKDDKMRPTNIWEIKNPESEAEVVISRAVPSDARAIMELKRDAQIDAYPNAEYGVTEDTIRKRYADLSEGISNWQDGIATEDGVNKVSFVARIGGEVVGFAHPVRANENGQQMIKQLYVRTDTQGRGVGKKLLQQAIGWLNASEDIRLHVVGYNRRAIGLYEQMGFEKTGIPITEEPDDNDDDPSYDIEMVLKAKK